MINDDDFSLYESLMIQDETLPKTKKQKPIKHEIIFKPKETIAQLYQRVIDPKKFIHSSRAVTVIAHLDDDARSWQFFRAWIKNPIDYPSQQLKDVKKGYDRYEAFILFYEKLIK